MKSLLRNVILIFSLSMFFSMAGSASAALDQIVLSDALFLTAEKGYYTEEIQADLETLRSPLALYSENIGDRQTSAAEMIWLGSQHMDFGVNPKVLMATLQTVGQLDSVPTKVFMLLVQEMTEALWERYAAYINGERTITLQNGTTYQASPETNAATFALASFFADRLNSETDVNTQLAQWKNSYYEIFGDDPGADPQISMPHAVPVVEPFLELPFTQPSAGFVGITSFFDHSAPGIYDDSILRFDGKKISPGTFSGCLVGVSCYGGHNGLDYRTGAGMPMRAAADGVVVYKYYNTDSSAGRVDSGVYIDHYNGYRTAYWHMDPIQVQYGQVVKAGEVIGLSGNIGMSSGPHLHFGLRLIDENKPVNPYGWWSTAVADSWRDSYWMWKGDLVADSDEAQAQLFYLFYWWRESKGYGGDSYWTQEVSGSSSSTNWGMWGAYLKTPGQYNVYAYWPKDAENTKKARYQIHHSGGATTVQVDQSANGDQFVYLGTYNFSRGAAAVILTDYTGESGRKVQFDAVKWELTSGTPTPVPLGNSTYDDNDSRIRYSANWAMDILSGPYQDTRHFSNMAGSTASLDFIGQQVGVAYTSDNDRGSLEVYIDGVLTQVINQRTASVAWQQRWLSLPIASGWHHLELRHGGGGVVDLDAVMIFDTVQTGTPGLYPTATVTPTATKTPNSNHVNLALNKTAEQSSSYADNYGTGAASRAVDGGTNGVYSSKSISHTLLEIQPWWQVDLGAVQPIVEIDVWNRTDCCGERLSDFYVLVSNEPFANEPFSSGSLSTVRAQSGVSAFHVSGEAGRPTTVDINRSGRYVRIQLSGSNYLSLAEVQVWALSSSVVTATPTPTSTRTPTATATTTTTATQLPTIAPPADRVNIAQGRSASQSSDYIVNQDVGEASRAVDGSTDGRYKNGSTSHTLLENQPWWQVDLGAVQPIAEISLWNRSDCCQERLSNFYVLVSDNPFVSGSLSTVRAQSGVSAFYVSGEAGRPTTVDINRSGRYVRIQLSGSNYLSLAEVEVWALSTSVATATPSHTSTRTPTQTAVIPTATPTATLPPSSTAPAGRVNIAQGRSASQSSDYVVNQDVGEASRAVDGSTDGRYKNGSTSHTLLENQPWWQVDLGAVQPIAEISLWNRSDCCQERLSNFYVLVSDNPFVSGSLSTVRAQSGVSAFHVSGEAGRPTTVDINRSGRFVRVQLSGSNYLSLAEVEVWNLPSPVTATRTPTVTPTRTATVTPTRTATVPASTRTPTPTTVTVGPPYAVQAGSPVYLPNFAHPVEGDNWLGVAGQVFSASGAPVNQLVVVVKGTLLGEAFEAISLTGVSSAYGPGGYEIVLNNAPVNTQGALSITLYSLAGEPISEPFPFNTFADPLKNLVLINFEEQ